MGYLKEFQKQLTNRDFAKFLKLWEEYCTCDEADIEELATLLNEVKASDFAKSFGQYVEMAIPLWQTITDEKDGYRILSLILDLQTTNSQELAELASEALVKRYGQVVSFQDREIQEHLRLVGLRTKEQFQGALANFDLLIHLKKGNFVFHESGYGTGEIMDYSPLRELVSVEFENVTGLKQITFTNSFKSLIPLPKEHFLAKRFANPDAFEKEAKADPVAVIKLLLKDLGPKTAAELKDELCDLVIPEKDWQKWWQNARVKLKRDTEIDSPESPKNPFRLRSGAISHEDQFLETIQSKKAFKDILLSCYAFIRDHASKLKSGQIKETISSLLEEPLKSSRLNAAEKLQAYFCLESLHGPKYTQEISKIIHETDSFEALIENIEILVYKKLAIAAIQANIQDWPTIYLKLLHTCTQGLLRDYLIKELIQDKSQPILVQGLQHLLEHPWENPDLFFWYYLKMMQEPDERLPFHDEQGKDDFSQALLVLLNRIENDSGQKDLVKKISVALAGKRYALVRQIFEGSSLEFAKEFLLLASKCHTLTDHDLKIWRSLAEVVHPVLASSTNKKGDDHSTLWTTEENLIKQQERLKKIATTEVVENAKEIEAARALGDLRENSEYKSALEKRSHLQREIKKLSQDISHARILTPLDVQKEEVGIGSVIHAKDTQGHSVKFTIMGPWEADPDLFILSSQSKVAQGMIGLQKGDRFNFKDAVYVIEKLDSIFDGE